MKLLMLGQTVKASDKLAFFCYDFSVQLLLALYE